MGTALRLARFGTAKAASKLPSGAMESRWSTSPTENPPSGRALDSRGRPMPERKGAKISRTRAGVAVRGSRCAMAIRVGSRRFASRCAIADAAALYQRHWYQFREAAPPYNRRSCYRRLDASVEFAPQANADGAWLWEMSYQLASNQAWLNDLLRFQ